MRSVHPGLAGLALAGWVLAGCGTTPTEQAGPDTNRTELPATANVTPKPSQSATPATTPSSPPPKPASSPRSTSTPQPPPFSATPSPSHPTLTELLRPGDHGAAVLALQRRLVQLGYWLGVPDGNYGDLTTQAVLAVQKSGELTRDGVVGPQTRAALQRGLRPSARSSFGRVIEIDKSRQILLVADNGWVRWVLNTSTGSGGGYVSQGRNYLAVTPGGRFRIFRQVNGEDVSPLGALWRPKYFNGGIAIHGYPEVPAYPASHGCVRVSDPAIDFLWARDLAPIGTPVWVY